MADKVKIWFDPETDYLEVQFSDVAGHMQSTRHDAVMERVDAQGRVLGFGVLGVSQFKKDKPLVAELEASTGPVSVREKPDKKTEVRSQNSTHGASELANPPLFPLRRRGADRRIGGHRPPLQDNAAGWNDGALGPSASFRTGQRALPTATAFAEAESRTSG